MRNLIGKKARGFKFNSTEKCDFTFGMEEKIGEIGTITRYDEWENSYKITFDDGDYWFYPATEIEKHLIDLIQELSDGVLMEVDDDEEFSDPVKRLVFGKKNGRYLAWVDGTDYWACNSWKYARPIKEEEEDLGTLTMTLEEAIKALEKMKYNGNIEVTFKTNKK